MKSHNTQSVSMAACLLMAAMALIAIAVPARAQTASLVQCKELRDRIEHYTVLRRKGGSASAMAGWKKQLRRYETDFRHFDCLDYGSELR